jgi:hypothetical protein
MIQKAFMNTLRQKNVEIWNHVCIKTIRYDMLKLTGVQ